MTTKQEIVSKSLLEYHFIGIGGIGMSGLARLLLQKGISVSGSDMCASSATEALQQLGATIYIGHNAEHVRPTQSVVFNTDIPPTNPEFLTAKKYGCPLMHRSDVLTQLMEGYRILAVTGTHGKTTTTALLAHVLDTAGCSPSFAIGGMLPHLGTNAHRSTGEYFVVEADESDGTMLQYPYEAAIVTNIDSDHVAYYGSMEKLEEAMLAFMKKAQSPDLLFLSADCPRLSRYQNLGRTYGFANNANMHITNFAQEGFEICFNCTWQGRTISNIRVNLIGKHNASNAAAVLGLCLTLGIDEAVIRKAFMTFLGVGRRMEKKSEYFGITVIDDYGHHPVEIRATLEALRAAVKERRLIAVFQPHRYTRMLHAMDSLHGAFGRLADIVCVTDLYTAREEPIEGVTTERIIAEIQKEVPSQVRYIPRTTLVEQLNGMLQPHDVVILFGAGDSTKAAEELATTIKNKPPRKCKVGVFFGGMSCEHEVSHTSVKNILKQLRSDIYDATLFKITKTGHFIECDNNFNEIENKSNNLQPVAILPSSILEKLQSMDVVIPVLHGPFGEDGTVQGFLEVLGIPYVGCDVRASSLCMDKAMMKILAEHHAVPVLPYVAFDAFEWTQGSKDIMERIESALTYPVFVKPTHLGSSVGITKVSQAPELASAVDKAFQYDTHVLVEQGVHAREIEFALRGNVWVEVPPPGEVFTHGAFFDYEAKYGKDGFHVTPCAELPGEAIDRGRALAEKIYRAAGCTGLARVDFFYEEAGDGDGKFWFNEINPFPGFTQNSLYPKIWEQKYGVPELLDTLIMLALHRGREGQIFLQSCLHYGKTPA